MATEITVAEYEAMDAMEQAIVDREVREGRAKVLYPSVVGIPVVVDESYEVGTVELRDSRSIRSEGALCRITNLTYDPPETRDLRDPSELGMALLSKVLRNHALAHFPDEPTLSQRYDFAEKRGMI